MTDNTWSGQPGEPNQPQQAGGGQGDPGGAPGYGAQGGAPGQWPSGPTAPQGGDPYYSGNPGTPGAPAGGYGQPGDPAYNQGGYGQPGMSGGAWGPGETLVADPPKKSRKGLVLGSAAAVLAVVAGAGIYVATQLSGGGLQPEGLAPATTFAFAKVDLDPAANQKVAARKFADNFPGAPKSSADDVFESFVAEAFNASEDVNYEADIKPWLGKRVGIAGFVDKAGEAQAVGIVQVEDEAKARTSLDKLKAQAADSDDEFAYAIHRGYAVVSDTQPVVDEVTGAQEDKTLAANDTYSSDIGELSGDQVIVGWADFKAVYDLMKKESEDFAEVPEFFDKFASGRFVLGAHAANDYVEIEGFQIGGNTETLKNGKHDVFANLPADTIAAFSINNLGPTMNTYLEAFAEMGFGDLDTMLEEVKAMTGLDVRENILPALGDQTVFALGSFDATFTTVRAAMIALVKDTANAKKVADTIEQFNSDLGMPIETEVAGNNFYISFGPNYLSKLKSEHGLKDQAMFKKAMGELGNNVAAAAFVDLSKVWPQVPTEMDPNITAIKAVGMSAGLDGDKGYFRVRVVAGRE